MRSTVRRTTARPNKRRLTELDSKQSVEDFYKSETNIAFMPVEAVQAIEERSAVMQLVCGAYAMITSVWSMCFPLTQALTYVNSMEEQPYPQIFAIYLYGLSCIMMVYMLCQLFGSRRNKNKDHKQLRDLPPDIAPRGGGSSSSVHSGDIEGAGIYIRIGGRVFGVGAMVFNAMRFAAHVTDLMHEPPAGCESMLFVIENVLQFFFVLIQMIFCYKCNRVVIKHQPQLSRFCLTHIMVTNIRSWLNSLVHETMEDMATIRSLEHQSNKTADSDHGDTAHVSSGHGDELYDLICHGGIHRVVHTVSVYLIPCLIEYSIISAVVVYCIYANVGIAPHSDAHLHANQEEKPHLKMSCGLLVGGVPVVFTIMSVIIQFIYKNDKVSETAFYATSHTLFVMTTAAILLGFWATRHLHFHVSDHGVLDIILLMISMVGNYCFQVFYLGAAWQGVKKGEAIWMEPFLRALQGIIQPIFQTVFILEGLRKRANTVELVEEKPGRNIVLFILNCNLSLWIVETFAANQIDKTPIAAIFGQETWLIMFHLFIPFVIFYRFHSTACLAEICGEAYSDKNIT